MTSSVPGIARRYGKALLRVVVDQKGDAREVAESLAELAGRSTAHTDVERVLASPAVPVDRKLLVLDALGRGKVLHPFVSNLLNVLAKNDRLSLLPAVDEAYRKALDAHEGVIEGEVVTPEPLGDSERKALEARLSQLSGKTLKLRYRTDLKLLGGLVVRTGNTIYDASVVTQLETFKRRVLAAY